MKNRKRKGNTSLRDLRVGQQGVVTEIRSSGPMKRRLVDMGITPGTTVFVRKVAPLGDPMQIHLRGYELLVRESDARDILIAEK